MEEIQTYKGFRWEKRKCVDCGKEFICKNPRSVRCLDCREVYHKEQVRQYKQKEKEAELKTTTDDLNICKKIKSCYYGGYMGAEHICDYLGKTGVRRPCKAGECYFYKRKGRKNEQDRNSQGDM